MPVPAGAEKLHNLCNLTNQNRVNLSQIILLYILMRNLGVVSTPPKKKGKMNKNE